MPTLDPNIAAHLEWLGFVRPTGLVLSAPALVNAGAILNRRDGWRSAALLRNAPGHPLHERLARHAAPASFGIHEPDHAFVQR